MMVLSTSVSSPMISRLTHEPLHFAEGAGKGDHAHGHGYFLDVPGYFVQLQDGFFEAAELESF